jgi:hypothetical protein
MHVMHFIWMSVIFFCFFSHLYFFVVSHMGLFHGWSNMTAELMYFGDRRFYAEFYKQSNVPDFFVNWNFLVQNWLFRYIYLPASKYVSKEFAATLSLLVSHFFHDYCAFIFSGYFSLLLFTVIPTIGIAFMRYMRSKDPKTKPSLWNYILMFLAFSPQGLVLMVFVIEFYAKRNCPEIDSSFRSIFYPRFLSCLQIYH